MAARASSSRQLLCGALCSLLWVPVIHSIVPTGTTRALNGTSFTLLNAETKYTWNEAMAKCSSGLLWLHDLTETKWVTTQFDLSQDVWTAAQGGDSKWPNGKSFPASVPANTDSTECLKIDVSKPEFKWEACTAENFVICKPFSSCGRSLFRRLAEGRSHDGEALQVVRERSLVACAAVCAGRPGCCVFEFWRETHLCRLLTATRENQWTAKEGAELYSLEA